MQTGIISYGVSLPKYRIEASEIWKVWKNLSTSFFDMLSIGERGVPNKHCTLRVVPMPADLNQNGDVFGGWVMAQVDVAGAIPAMRRACGRVATVSVNSFLFKQPVSVGDIVSLYADIVRVGTTSITVRVEVYAERNYAAPIIVKVTEAELTYVAIDGAGMKRKLPAEK